MTRGGWNAGYAQAWAPAADGLKTATASNTGATTRRTSAARPGTAAGSEARTVFRINFLRGSCGATSYRNAYDTAAPNTPLVPPKALSLSLPPNSYPAVNPM